MRIIKYSGIVGIFLEYAGIVFLLSATHQTLNADKPISYYGTLASTQLAFSLFYMFAGIAFGLFGYWLYRLHKLGLVYVVALVTAVFAQILLSWLPDAGGTALLHLGLAILVITAMPVMVFEYSKTARNKSLRQFSQIVVLVEVLALLLLPVCFKLGYSLLPEAVTVAVFQAWVVLVTFLDGKARN